MNAGFGKSMDITLMGLEFRIVCADDEHDELLEAIGYLEKKMREIRASGRVVGSERVAIMAALSITHELLTSRKQEGFDMGEFKRRIVHMQATLDAVIPEQDKLF